MTGERLRTSALLLGVVAEHAGERFSLRELLDRLGERSYGLLLLVLAVPNLLPNIPGINTLFGLLLMLVAIQMAAGLPRPWLPAVLLRRTFPQAGLAQAIARILPHLRRAERLLRPRWLRMSSAAAERLLGVLCLALGLVIALPLPFANWLPAFAVTVTAFGLAERDGVVLAAGMALGGVVLAVVIGLLATAAGSLPMLRGLLP